MLPLIAEKCALSQSWSDFFGTVVTQVHSALHPHARCEGNRCFAYGYGETAQLNLQNRPMLLNVVHVNTEFELTGWSKRERAVKP